MQELLGFGGASEEDVFADGAETPSTSASCQQLWLETPTTKNLR